jgi:ABC-type polysaccharide/polyol phosphate export permease
MCVEAGRRRRDPLRERVVAELPLLRLWIVRVFRTRYRQSALDVVWSVLNPVVVLAVYGLIFTAAFDVTGDGIPYLSFAWAGLVVWTFFSTALASAAPSISTVADTIAKVYFPREVVPLAEVGAGVIDLGISLAILVTIAVVQGTGPSITAVGVIPVLLALVAWTAALSTFAAVASVFLRDLRPTVGLLLRVGFIATPIMYPVSDLPDWARWTASVNPIAVFIEGVRDTMLRGVWPDWPLLAVQAAIGLVLLVASIAYTRSVENRMVDVV